MGLTRADLEIENQFSGRKLKLKALVDTGSVFMTIPEHAAIQLGFDVTEVQRIEVSLADGSKKLAPMVGPLRVYFNERYCDLSALVIGDEALFGAVPMEMMDLLVHPAKQTLVFNPDSPFIPTASLK